MGDSSIEKSIRWSGLFVCCGIAILLVSLLWSHPLSFMLFLGLGFPLVGVGVLVFLYALAVKRP